MDRPSGKRGAGGNVTPRKTYNATPFKEAATEGDHAQFCNRIGCSGRVKFGQNSRVGISDTSKYSKPSLRSSNGNEVTGKFSRSNSDITTTRLEARAVVSTSSNLSGDKQESITSGSSSASSSVGPRKTFRSKSGLSNQSASLASPVPSASRSSALGPFNRINGSRYLRCNSMSDAMPHSCSQLESESVKKNYMKKRSSEGESSSSYRGRKNTASSNIDRHTSLTTSGISVSDSAYSNSASVEDSRRRSTRFASRQDGRNSPSVREPAVSFSSNDNETPSDAGEGSNLHQISSGSRSHRLSSINSDNSSPRTSFASAESGLTHLRNHDVLRRFNVNEIAEVLMALERIEQDHELTHEQILALETRLFLSGLNLYDQHRDMRLDIDNMSYEELLALEEKMGTVSTALPEEALSKCITRSIYKATQSEVEITGSGEDGDDTKCSICQEEFASGDEIGNLVECQHGYHATCINEWLQLKNWCPICKASVAPSHSSLSS